MLRTILSICFILSKIQFLIAQENYPKSTAAEDRYRSYLHKQKMISESLVKNIELESIGPTIMSGRAVDIDVSPYDPTHFYVAYASGGLWKTTNNGISFFPVFDNQIVMTIGDVAVDWKNDEIIWVGTGENNSSRSSYSGFGIFKSTDKGKSWVHKGLSESHHIGRIVIHPQDKNVIWVAAVGHLYSPNEERGVFKTIDGGESWEKVLYIDENTGAIDLVIDPINHDVLYCAMWYRTRRAWNFEESGKTSGIYKSTDGGESWFLLSTSQSGFPTGDGVGRIGLAIYPPNPNIIYALLDNQFDRPESKKDALKLTKEKLKKISIEEFLKLEENVIEEFLRENNFPEKYTAKKILEMIESKKITPLTLVEYLEDANTSLFEKNVIGPEVYKSTNGGLTWIKMNKDYIDDTYYSYGYYFGQIRVSPFDENQIYLLGVPILKSTDGGVTFRSIDRENVHVDHHDLYINPSRKGHLILANDGGINISYDDGETWFKANTPPVGQFYSIEVDMEKPYNVYGGLQDNGVWYGPSNYKFSYRWYETGEYPYKNLLGGDGMQVEVDTRDNKTIYTGYQFGNYFRFDRISRKRTSIKPKHELGERPFRFNWNTPIHLSKHNQDILYIGANKLFRSMNRGDSYEIISPDLTTGGKAGEVPYGTITTIHESPLKFGLIYVGTDDGLIHVTKDGGSSWKRISDNLPHGFWVSRVIASKFDLATCYVSLNGYRWDNFESHIYKSTNFGESWERIGLNLPLEPINVVSEDTENENILYVGTDHGVYVSLDGGKNFMPFVKGFPSAPVHDLVVHPRDKELIVATHGRSLYKVNVEHIQKLNDKILQKQIHIFELPNIVFNKNWGNKSSAWSKFIKPELVIAFYSKQNQTVNLKIFSEKNLLVYNVELTADQGLNYFKYDQVTDSVSLKKLIANNTKMMEKYFVKKDDGKYYLIPGKYNVVLETGKFLDKQSFEILEQRK